MRLLKLFLISVVAFSVLILALSLLFPSSVRISRAINVAVSKDMAWQGLGNIRQWEDWNLMISNPELTNKRLTDSVFLSDQLKVAILSSTRDSVFTSWTFSTNEAVKSGFHLITAGDSTVIQWFFDFKLKWYPWEKFGSIIFDKQLGGTMESSLTNFKKFVENKP